MYDCAPTTLPRAERTVHTKLQSGVVAVVVEIVGDTERSSLHTCTIVETIHATFECDVVAVVVGIVEGTERSLLQTSTTIKTSIDRTGTAFGNRH